MNGKYWLALAVVAALFALAWAILSRDTAQGQVSACGGVSGGTACRPTFATVATLPACNAGQQGIMFMVNDATTPTALATVAGGGAVHVGVTCNGANWIVE
jgi:hypothetical protein